MSSNHYVVINNKKKIVGMAGANSKADVFVVNNPGFIKTKKVKDLNDFSKKAVEAYFKTKYPGYKYLFAEDITTAVKTIKTKNKKKKKKAKSSKATTVSNTTVVKNNPFSVSLTTEEFKLMFPDYTRGIAFVDGSCKDNNMGSGSIIVAGGQEYIFSSFVTSDNATSLTAEMVSFKQAIAQAVALAIKELFVCYDCDAIRDAVENPKSKNSSDEFKKFYKAMSSLIKVTLIKVKAHSGVPMNEAVDKIASVVNK